MIVAGIATVSVLRKACPMRLPRQRAEEHGADSCRSVNSGGVAAVAKTRGRRVPSVAGWRGQHEVAVRADRQRLAVVQVGRVARREGRRLARRRAPGADGGAGRRTGCPRSRRRRPRSTSSPAMRIGGSCCSCVVSARHQPEVEIWSPVRNDETSSPKVGQHPQQDQQPRPRCGRPRSAPISCRRCCPCAASPTAFPCGRCRRSRPGSASPAA